MPYIEQWINSTSGFVVNGSYVELITTCSVVIPSLDSEDCPRISANTYQDLSELVISGIVIIGILVIMLLVAVVILFACLKPNRRNRAETANAQTVNR